MILTCPACSSRYLIEPAALGGGRAVRCANCGHRWFVAPPADAPPRPSPGPPPEPLPHLRGDRGPAEDPGRSRGLIAWGGIGPALLLVAGAVVGRNEVVASFPAAAAVYGQLGLPVTVPLGLEFRDVTTDRLAEGDVEVLVVEGEIINVTGHDRVVPWVRVALLDVDKRELEHQVFAAEDPALEGGGATRFTARLVNPPAQARNFEVTFAADG